MQAWTDALGHRCTDQRGSPPGSTARDHLARPTREIGAPKPTKGGGELPAQGADRGFGDYILYMIQVALDKYL